LYLNINSCSPETLLVYLQEALTAIKKNGLVNRQALSQRELLVVNGHAS